MPPYSQRLVLLLDGAIVVAACDWGVVLPGMRLGVLGGAVGVPPVAVALLGVVAPGNEFAVPVLSYVPVSYAPPPYGVPAARAGRVVVAVTVKRVSRETKKARATRTAVASLAKSLANI